MQGHVRKRHKPECSRRLAKAARREQKATPTPGGERQSQPPLPRCDCSGSWQGRYRDPLDGHFIERTFRTKVEAEDWLTTQQGAMLTGTHINPRLSDTRFKALAEAWQESWPNRLSPTTAARYRSILNVYLLPTFGGVPIVRIDHGVVQRFVNRLTAEGMTPGTVRNVYSVLRNAMNQGLRLGMVKANPCTNVDLPRSPRQEMLFLLPEEQHQIGRAHV